METPLPLSSAPIPQFLHSTGIRPLIRPKPTYMKVASSARASRAANPPQPSNLAVAAAISRQKMINFESSGLDQHPNPTSRSSHVEKTFSGGGTKRSRRSHVESHLLSLHSRDVNNFGGEPCWPSFYSSLPISPHGVLLSAAIRSSSVRVSSVVEKAQNLSGQKMGSSNQTTRVSTQNVTSAWSVQATACMVALGTANKGFDDPRSTGALSPAALLGPQLPEVFVVGSTATSLALALPTRLSPASLLETMKTIAQKELTERMISLRIRQETTHLQEVCERIVQNTHGDLVWASFALLSYLSNEARGREILREYPVSDLDVSVCETLLTYGRSEITRRARLSEAQLLAEDEARREAGGEAIAPAPEAEEGTLVGEIVRLQNVDEESQPDSESTVNTMKLEDDDDDASSDEELAELQGSPRPGTGGSRARSESSMSAVGRVRSSAALRAASRMEALSGVNTQVLSAKRKRPSSFSPGGSALILSYWVAALNSQHSYVLLMLISSSRQAANDAAELTVGRQLEESAVANASVTKVSQISAVKSAQALRVLVKVTDTPRVLTWRAPHIGNGVHTGIARSEEDLSKTALLCCSPAPEIASVEGGHVRCAWVKATHLPSGDGTSAPLPAVTETYHRLSSSAPPPREGMSKAKLADFRQRLKGMMDGMSSGLAYTGIARSVLTFRVRMVTASDQIKRGSQLRAMLESEHRAHGHRGSPAHLYEVATCLASKNLESQITDPLATPGNNLALALQASETLAPLYKLRPRSGNPARVFLGVQVYPGEESDASVDLYNKPNAVLRLVDAAFEPLEEEKEPGEEHHARLPTRPDALHVRGALSFTVAGDSAVRVVEAAMALEDFWQARALLLAAASTASFVEEQTNQMCAGALNVAIASAKRVTVPDNQKHLRLTPWQVFRVGHRSVKSSFETTAWAGAHPVGLELGSGGGLGRQCSAETADRRNHGKMLMSQQVSDEYCAALADRMYVQVSPTHYDRIPVATRGIPHHAIPGLHTFLSDVSTGLDAVREAMGIESHTVDSLQCLPFGPYAESLAPNCGADDATAGARFRNRFDRLDSDGRSFLIDATVEDAAIFREPLVRRLQMIDPSDNPFASNAEQLSVLLNALSTIALLAKACFLQTDPEEAVAQLWTALERFHAGEGAIPCQEYALAADTMALLSAAVYPVNLAVGEPMVPEVYVAAHAQVRPRRRGEVHENGQSIDSELWESMTRDTESSWPALEAVMVRLLRDDGRCDLTLEDLSEMKQLMDEVLQGAWRVASPDGVAPPPAPHPMSGAACPGEVTSEGLLPIFVDKYNADDETWTIQRGAPIGCKPGGYRQLLALLIGSASCKLQDLVKVQLWRNEGGLLLRPSSAPDILNAQSKPRSDKATSPCMIDGDSASFGTRDAKLRCCARQRKAWDENLRLLIPLCVNISPPARDVVGAHRGELTTSRFVRAKVNSYRLSGITTVEDSDASEAFSLAAEALSGEWGD